MAEECTKLSTVQLLTQHSSFVYICCFLVNLYVRIIALNVKLIITASHSDVGTERSMRDVVVSWELFCEITMEAMHTILENRISY
jgi:hypothetical protein